MNFALGKGFPVEPEVLRNYFDPSKFLIKLTPVNPTVRSLENNIDSLLREKPEEVKALVDMLKMEGFDVIVSVGELEENKIGSNCGQFIMRYINSRKDVEGSYEYRIYSVE